MKTTFHKKSPLNFILWWLLICSATDFALAITPAQTPLDVGVTSAKPNIMLMIDSSGSMKEDLTTSSTIVSPSGAPANFSYSCPKSNLLSGGITPPATPTTTINMTVNSTGTVKVCTNSSCSKSANFGTKKGGKCFNNTNNYSVAYYNGSSLGGPYTGKQLNWYFSKATFTSGSLVGVTTSTSTRTAVAKQAATDLVTSLTPSSGSATVRMGLARYDDADDDGGILLSEIMDLDSTQSTKLQDQIADIPANGYTPLAETLSDIGKYFATGESSNLTLHPATTKSTASVASVFSKANGTSRTIKNSTGNNTLASPIQGYCQKSFVILVSDGLPTKDTEISTYLQNYTNGEEYLDDVAQALYEMDLRPTLDATQKSQNHAKNNVVTYAIGFADPSLNTNSVLSNAAKVGGGKFYFAENSKDLASALDDTIGDISSKVGSSSSVAANSSKLENGSIIYQAKFDSADWTGSISAFPIGTSEDTNGNGALDSGEDINSNGKLDGGSIGSKAWNAAELIPAYASRNIITYNNETLQGADFTCDNLSASQKITLGITSCTSTDQGVWRLNYIRGDWSHEQKNPDAVNDTIRTGANLIFRNRTHLDKITGATITPDPWVLGDIVNSDPVFVGAENYGYNKLTGEGLSYKAFVISNKERRKMVYVGANDGMLHGFDASTTSNDAGKEILAYVPNAVYDQLVNLSAPNYNHAYSVDGSPRASDVYFNGAWHTVLLGSTGAGGKAVFALDITNPSNFNSSKVLWEVSDAFSPEPTDRTTDTTTLRGFGNNLGYTISQPSIARMQNGSWAAIIANGYGSANDLAVLYIVDIQTGHVIKAFDTQIGNSSTPNGLSTPIAVDHDNDKKVDAIYAGDLLGNMWKFDVSSNDITNWQIAFSASPLFVACTDPQNCNTTRQPITGKPQVGKVGSTQTTNGSPSGVMVYFGTGKYFEENDKDVSNAQIQTFYGIWDNNAAVSKSYLQVQTISAEVTSGGYNLRATTDNAVNYPSQKGWYMNLLEPGTSKSSGERVVSAPLLRNGRIIFETLIPIPSNGTQICDSGSGVTSWLMELDALTGKRLPATAGGAPWDITGDGIIDANDLITVTIDGQTVTVAPSGKESKVGGVDTPGVVTNGKLEYKYTSGSKDAELEITTEQGAGSTTTPGSRQSWRQILQ